MLAFVFIFIPERGRVEARERLAGGLLACPGPSVAPGKGGHRGCECWAGGELLKVILLPFLLTSVCNPMGGIKSTAPDEPRLEPGASEDTTVVAAEVPEMADQPPEERAEAVPLDENVVEEELRR